MYTERRRTWQAYWLLLLVALFLPLLGLLLSIIGLAQDRAGSGFMLFVSLLGWALGTLIVLGLLAGAL